MKVKRYYDNGNLKSEENFSKREQNGEIKKFYNNKK